MEKRITLFLLTAATMIGIGAAQALKLSDYVVTTDSAEYVSIYSPSRYGTCISMPFDSPLGGRVIPQGTGICLRKSYPLPLSRGDEIALNNVKFHRGRVSKNNLSTLISEDAPSGAYGKG